MRNLFVSPDWGGNKDVSVTNHNATAQGRNVPISECHTLGLISSKYS
jgi:hypothetical protein